MEKRSLIGLIIVIGVLSVIGFFWFVRNSSFEDSLPRVRESECVPASCCHATECVLESEAPNCSGSFCSMSCEPGTLDCGQARCEFVDGECGVVFNE